MVAYLGGHFYNHQWHHSEKLLVHSCPENIEQNLIAFASNLQNTRNSELHTNSIVEALRSPLQLQSQSAVLCCLDTFTGGMVQGQGATKCFKRRAVNLGSVSPVQTVSQWRKKVTI